jgi:hypothetical protein
VTKVNVGHNSVVIPAITLSCSPTITMNPLRSSNRDSEAEALPEDIARIVFELAAEAGDGASCARVSKKVQSW